MTLGQTLRRSILAAATLIVASGLTACATVIDPPPVIPSVSLPDMETVSVKFGHTATFTSGLSIAATRPVVYVPQGSVSDNYTPGVTTAVKVDVTCTNGTGAKQDIILAPTATSAGVNAPQVFDLALNGGQGSSIMPTIDPGGHFTWTLLFAVADPADITLNAACDLFAKYTSDTAVFTF